jgi:integrase
MAFTKKKIDGLRYDGRSRDIRWEKASGDDGLPGFGVRIQPGGAKAFVLQYRSPDGRVRLKKIGSYPPMTLSEARDRARKDLVDLIDDIDPLKAQHSDMRLKKFAAIYIEQHAKPFRVGSWKEDQRRLGKHILPSLGSRSLTSIERADLDLVHKKIGRSSPVEANRVLGLMSNLFNVAEQRGFVPDGHPNPTRRIKRYPEQSRERYLDEEEVERLWTASAGEDRYFQAWIALGFLTGMRKMETLELKWADVDLVNREVHLPKTKSARPLTLPLSEEAISIFEGIPRQGVPWVFPGPNPSTHRMDFKKQWKRVREKAALRDIKYHDLRRTTGSWLAQAGVPLEVIQKILNHSSAEVTRIYARLADKQPKDALDTLGKEMGKVLKFPIKGAS